ncbi:hypothetical protein L3X38_004114 [Prunus dulcis]|uniref:Integrase catalytic domain-containing protein n=1 Tax=Prunus dulcis TaxID=3755 RepID=A0AAD4ZNB4_PRUDU|nr:hypothetical protein L3X38_004114 [Prunus dulcis]
MTNLIKKGAVRSEKLLELIHTDICGPFPVNTHDGYRYFITFTDDFSRYGYVYLIAEKSKALDIFKIYKAEVENQLDSKIKVVRSDRGGEFYGKFTKKGRNPGPFAIFLQQEGQKATDFTAQITPPEETQRAIFIEEEKEETDTTDFEFEEIIESNVNAEAGNKEKGVTILSFDNLNKEISPAHEDLNNHQNAEVEIHQNVEVEMQLNLPEQPQTTELRRSQRTRRPALPNDYFVYLQEYEFDINTIEDPATYKQAMESEKNQHWFAAMESKLESMSKNGVWSLDELPSGSKPTGCKWVYKTKRNAQGKIDRYRARLVAKGFTQQEGVDYNETFSPVSTKDSFRVIMALVAHFDLHLHQMDVKTTFLNGNLLEEIYMKQLDGEANYVLGIKISRDRDRKLIGLSQKAYIEKILKRFNMENCTGCDVPFSKGDKLSSEQSPKTEQERIEMQDKPYASLVGSLISGQAHWVAGKKVLRYLQRTKEYKLVYRRVEELKLEGYADADFVGCLDTQKCTSGVVFLFAGGAIAWKSVKQQYVSTSTMQAEFLAVYEATSMAIWLKNFM